MQYNCTTDKRQTKQTILQTNCRREVWSEWAYIEWVLPLRQPLPAKGLIDISSAVTVQLNQIIVLQNYRFIIIFVNSFSIFKHKK